MRSFDEALNLLLYLSKEVTRLERACKQLNADTKLGAGDKAERGDKIVSDMNRTKRQQTEVLQNLVAFPPHHAQYAQYIQQFSQAASCERSVFVMTKYPDGKDAQKDAELTRVIKAVTDAVTECQFAPRLANAAKYHPNLWENVELYVLACCRGIAIVEDKFRPHLNPNVAMEWGWMRAMKKPVLYLVEQDVEVVPADVLGLISDRFLWDAPEPAVRDAVFKELTGAPPP